MNSALDKLIAETWQDFQTLKSQPETAALIVPNAMPLLWFGDLPAYENSTLKILTLSKNPSYAEFGEPARFAHLANITGPSQAYQDALNAYFTYQPSKWFKPLSKLLNYLEADYQNAPNIALHADLFTPIPTQPVWPGLKDKQRYFDMKFPKLLKILQPDLIITSLSAKNLQILLAQAGHEALEVFHREEPNKAAKYIKAYLVDKQLLIINGRNFQGSYFGGMTDDFISSCFSEIKQNLIK